MSGKILIGSGQCLPYFKNLKMPGLFAPKTVAIFLKNVALYDKFCQGTRLIRQGTVREIEKWKLVVTLRRGPLSKADW